MLAGVIPMELTVFEVSEGVIKARIREIGDDYWQFDVNTGAEIDPDLGWDHHHCLLVVTLNETDHIRPGPLCRSVCDMEGESRSKGAIVGPFSYCSKPVACSTAAVSCWVSGSSPLTWATARCDTCQRRR